MPMTIEVGLSRKASRNYQSSGASINVTAELDGTLLSRPDELQQHIAALYRQAKTALDRQLEATGPASPDQSRPPATPERITAAQRRVLVVLAERRELDLDDVCREQFNRPPGSLTRPEAARLIDHLKSIPNLNGNGRAR